MERQRGNCTSRSVTIKEKVSSVLLWKSLIQFSSSAHSAEAACRADDVKREVVKVMMSLCCQSSSRQHEDFIRSSVSHWNPSLIFFIDSLIAALINTLGCSHSLTACFRWEDQFTLLLLYYRFRLRAVCDWSQEEILLAYNEYHKFILF